MNKATSLRKGNKMKLRQISFKIISLVMVFTMLFSVSATTISAAAEGNSGDSDIVKETLNYVSLGASNVNGYGMHGYLEEEVYEHPLLKEQSNIYGYKQDTPGSYPVLIKDALSSKYNVNLSQLAMSSMRAEEVRFLLDDSYKGDAYTDWRFCDVEGYNNRDSQNWFKLAGELEWAAQGNAGTPTYEQAVNALKAAYRDAIKNADLITVDIGVNNFGVYASNQIVSNMYENDLNTIDPELAAKYAEGKDYVMDILADKASDYIAAMSEESLNHIVDTLAYALVGFCLSFDAVMEQIYTLNPDATVVVVSIQNLMYGFKASLPGVDVELPLGELFGALVNAANVYTATVSPYAGEYLYTDVRADGHVEFFMDEMLQYNGDPTTLSQNVKDCFDVYDGDLYIKTRVQQILAKELYKSGLLDVSKVPAGYDVVGNLEHFALAYQYDLLTIPALNCTLEQFFAAGAAGQLPDIAKPYYDGYVSVLNTAYDVCAEIMQAGLAIDTLDGSAFGQKFGPVEDQIFGEIFGVLEAAVGAVMADPSFEFSLDEASQLLYGSTDFFTAVAEKYDIDPGFVKTVAAMGIRTGIGSSFFGHPNGNGQKELSDAILATLENGTTGADVMIDEAIKAAEDIMAFIEEYYDDAYAYAYAELKANGVIAEVNAALDAAIEAVAAAHAEVEGFDVEAKLEETKALIVKELALTEATLYQIKVLVGYETITEDYLETLKDLLELLEGHLENVGAIATELGGIVLDEAIKAVNAAIAELEILVNELAEKAYEYILEKAPVIYEQFVNAVVENVKYYSHEAAKACYYWLLNNPETVIEFFETYGDDIVDFIADNYQIIFGVIGFVGANYGEEIVELVLDNADVIIPAVINWFEIHGDLVWDLIVVYFDAIVAYYDLGIDLDFSTIEGIQASFDKIFGLLGDLVDMIADGVYDYIEALGIVEKIQNELAKLETFIRDTIKEHIEALKDYVAEKIEAIKAEIQAQIDALEEALKNAADELKAEIQAQIDALKAKLEALVNAEIENLEDAVEALEKLLKEGVKDLGEYIYGVITEFVDAAVRGEFTPTEDSYYVSVNGGNAYYAELLAEALANNLDVDSIKLGNTVWGNIDYDMLSKADLVTIGYDENELSAFAVEQLLAYIANYADADLRNSTNEYVGNVFAALQNWIDGNKLNLDMGQYENETLAGINGVIDEILAYDLIAGKELTEMNWAEYVGEENLSYVDELRAELKSQLLEAGVIETFTYTVDIVAYIYENAEELGIPATVLAIVPQSTAYEILGENAYYTVEVPVADAIVFAAESYLYGYVEFNVTYGKLIVDLYKINPEATVILLGHYNAYDVEFAIGDVAVDLSEAYGYIAGISSVQPFAYALLSPNVSYVDISDAETVYESYVAEGFADGSLLEFVMMYLADSSITDVSEAGNVYIYEQIMNILTVGCEHVYDNACDAECNKCGEIREVPGHVYDNACDTSCNVCGEKRDVPAHVYVDGVCIYCGAKEKAEHVHEYDSCYDTVCKTCGEIREAEEHAYDDCTDTTCYKCKEVREAPGHEYDNCADTECNNCGYERKALNHVYSNACDADCNVCGESREAAAHVYSGCTDTDCNVCGEKREAGAHVVDDCADNICNVCGQNVATNGHKYGAWTVTVEATRKNAGEKTHTCEKCGKVETKTIAALGGIGGGAIAAIVIGSVVVAGAAGFAIYWFLIQKKTFAALVAAIKGVFGGNAAAGAAAPAAEAATAEAAEAAAEAPAADAEAPASEEETK